MNNLFFLIVQLASPVRKESTSKGAFIKENQLTKYTNNTVE
jgi:hypothetical protein